MELQENWLGNMTGVYTNTRLEILSSQSKVSNTDLTMDTHTHTHTQGCLVSPAQQTFGKQEAIRLLLRSVDHFTRFYCLA